MARSSGSRNDLVKCEYCGEMYSTTYKHCPFCNEDGTGRWDDPVVDQEEFDNEPRRRSGGKRLAGGGGGRKGRNDGPERPSLGTIIGVVLSLALIIAAVCIVVSIFRSVTGRGKTPTPTPPTVESQPVQSDPAESQPVESQAPPAPTTPSVDLVTPTDFTLSKSDFTFFKPGEIYDMVVTFTPADATAEVVWKSSDPNIASVSWNGRVTAVSAGTVTLTATVEGVGEKTCICRCTFTDAADPAPSDGGGSAASGLTLSREDFTLAFEGDSWKLVVSGTESPVTWASSKPEVATVDSEGWVTAVSKGTCNVTATVDGVTLSCIVRCNFQ